MKIFKAFLLTILLMLIYYIPQLGLFGLYEFTKLIGKGINEHIYAVAVLSSLISYLFVFYFYWKPRPNLKAIFNIKQLDLSLVPYLLVIVLGLGFVWQPLFDFDKIIDYYRTSEIKTSSNKFTGINGFFLYFSISSIIIAPVFEELFFRKFLFEKLLKNNEIWTSIIVSSLCFSAIHFETPNNLIPTFIFGVIACLIYLKTKNIVYLVIIHLMNNLCSILYSVYGEPFYDWVYSQNYGFMYWALFIFGVLITLLGIRKTTTANKNYT